MMRKAMMLEQEAFKKPMFKKNKPEESDNSSDLSSLDDQEQVDSDLSFEDPKTAKSNKSEINAKSQKAKSLKAISEKEESKVKESNTDLSKKRGYHKKEYTFLKALGLDEKKFKEQFQSVKYAPIRDVSHS
jgi:hypothetical protein